MTTASAYKETSLSGAIVLLIGLASTLPILLSLSPDYLKVTTDELTFAWSAARLTHGDLIYKDFFTHRPPIGIYSLAVAFYMFGQSLAVLRAVYFFAAVFTTLVVYAILRQQGETRGRAAVVGLLIPWALLWYWPVPSGHWESILPGLSSILLVERGLSQLSKGEGADRSILIQIFAGGVLAGITGLMIQTQGAIVCVYIFARLCAETFQCRRFAALILGIATPVVLTVAVLAAMGLLDDAVRDTVLWPAKYYRQAGGFNSVPLAEMMSDALKRAQAKGTIAYLLHLAVMLLPVFVVIEVLGGAIFRRKRVDYARLAVVAIIFVTYLRGRTDWTHLVVVLPFLLLLLWQAMTIEKTWNWLVRVCRVWAFVTLGLAAGMWCLYMVERPANLRGFSVDEDMRRNFRAIQNMIPPQFHGEPMASFPYGSPVYLYQNPEVFRKVKAPRLDWVTPPAERYTTPKDYQLLADWLTKNHVPVVVLSMHYGRRFLEERSVLRETLVRDYGPYSQLGSLLVLLRREAYPAVGAWRTQKSREGSQAR